MFIHRMALDRVYLDVVVKPCTSTKHNYTPKPFVQRYECTNGGTVNSSFVQLIGKIMKMNVKEKKLNEETFAEGETS